MSEYGCCTLSHCNWQDSEGYAVNDVDLSITCDNCPYYDPNYFRGILEEEKDEVK